MKESLDGIVSSAYNNFRDLGGIRASDLLYLVVSNRYFGSNANVNADSSLIINDLLDSYKKLIDHLKIQTNYALLDFLENIRTQDHGKSSTLIQSIILINSAVAEEDFAEAFEYLFYNFLKVEGRRNGVFIYPLELTSFIADLINLKPYTNVYNPFAGSASFEIALQKPHKYWGSETNIQVWSLGVLRLFVHKKLNENVVFQHGDTLAQIDNSNIKFDLIVSAPPFGKIPFEGNKTYEELVIEKALEKLASQGRVFILVNNSFLFDSRRSLLRKRLISSDVLDFVITLPSGILPVSGVSTSLLVLDNRRQNKEPIKFVDGTSFIERAVKFEKILDNEKLLSAILNADPAYCFDSTSESVAKNDYILEPARYRLINKSYSGVPLSTVASFTRGASRYKETFGKIVKVRNLSDELSTAPININVLEDSPVDPKRYRKIDYSCVLVSVRYKKLKPTLFEYTGTPIFLFLDIAALVPHENISPIFLLSELESEKAVEQINFYRTTSIIPLIRREDLMSVKIELPSLFEQEERVIGLMQAEERIKRISVQNNELIISSSKANYDQFASLKHTLGTPREIIRGRAKSLFKFISNNASKFESLNADFKEIYEEDMLSAVDKIRQEINFMTEVLERGEKGLVLSEYPLTNIKLPAIKKMIQEISPVGFKYDLVRNFDQNVNSQNLSVTCNLTLLKILLDNILINADKHGFDESLPRNQVVISLFVEDSYLNLEIKNNGKPFPKNFSKEKFIEKFSKSDHSSGTGLGGYDIDQIAKYFFSDHLNKVQQLKKVLGKPYEHIGLDAWDLLLNEDPAYSVIFRFRFNIWITSMNL